MSKTLGNVIDPIYLADKYGADALRYFLLREISFGQDGDFSIKRLEERYNSDLANGLGNLVSRVLALSEKSNVIANTSLPLSIGFAKQSRDGQLAKEVKPTQEKYRKAMEEMKFNEALESIWQLISAGDEFVDKNKIWELVKTDSGKAERVLRMLLNTLKEIANLLDPFMPETSQKILEQIKQNKKSAALFPRL